MKKYKFLTVILSLLMLITNLEAYSGGDGTAESPYQIANANDLKELMADQDHWNSNFVQTVDIDLNNQTAGINPIGYWTQGGDYHGFSGLYDGANKKIYNLNLNFPNEDAIGFFGLLAGGTVFNLGLENVVVNGKDKVGCFAGKIHEGSVMNSYAKGEVHATGVEAGGFAGRIEFSNVSNSYAKASVSGSAEVAGFVGHALLGSITNCYSSGAVTGSSTTGGLVASIEQNCTISSSYWDKETSNQTTSAGGTGKTTAEMKNIITYENWEFPEVWHIDYGGANEGYPTLGWEGLPHNTNIVINFPDPNLEVAVRELINKPTGDIYNTDVVEIIHCSFNNKNISNLTGMEYFISLQSLSLMENQISNLLPLAGLNNLTYLHLWTNQISDISALASLTNLTDLRLGANQLSDISALANLTKLEILSLRHNQISDISPLSGLTNLKDLSINHNQVSNISVLANLTDLESLWIHNNQISNISVLANFTKLEMLHSNNNQISDISALVNLTNLEILGLGNNQISDLSVLANLTNLEILRLGNNQISNLQPLAGLVKLEELNLNTNQISDVSALADLTKLTELYLEFNQISNISALADLTKIQTLYIYHNQIVDISALANFINLKNLWISNNQISNISALASLLNLTYLNLYSNQIVDIQPLVDNSGMDNGDNLNLDANPLSEHSVNDLIPILEARGVNVHYTPAENNPPYFTSDPVTIGVVGENYLYNITVTDPDGDNLTITAVGYLPQWLTLTDNGNGSATLSGTPDDIGEYNVTLKVDDGKAKTRASVEQSFTISVTSAGSNQAPYFTSDPITIGVVGENYLYNITATDPDGDPLTITAVGYLPQWLTLTDNGNGSATLSGTPDDIGEYNVTLKVDDGQAKTRAFAEQSFTISVTSAGSNQAPYFISSPVTTGTVGENYLYNITATDPDGDPLTITAVGYLPQWLTLTDNGSGSATLSGTPDDIGEYNVTLKVDDGKAKTRASVEQSFTISVTSAGSNQAPYFISSPVTTGTVGESYLYNVIATDPDGDPLTITALGYLPQWLTLTDNGNGNAVLSGTPDDIGEYNVTLKVDDGGAKVKSRAFVEQSFTIEVADLIVISFPDPNLEAAVRELINKPTGDIYNTDVNTITNCNFGYRNISDLTGMEYFISLESLMLRKNQISDISALANLTELLSLRLRENQISDLPPLANLNKLELLELNYNQISNISSLSTLTNLEELCLTHNQISDISSLATLTNLKDLWLNQNQIVDIQPLVDNSGMDNGDKLYLNDNPLSQHSVNDLIPILEARGVDVHYDPSNNQAPSFISSPVTTGTVGESYLYNVIATDPDGDNLTITAPEKPEWLTLIDNGNGSATLSGTPTATGNFAVTLRVDDGGAKVKSRAFVEQSFTISVTTEAIVINFPDPNLEAAVRELINKPTGDIYNTDVNTITDCYFRDKNITNLTGMEYFISLQSLTLQGNQISDLSPLANLEKLESLDLENNQISDLSPLANLPELTVLDLVNNQISDISALSGLTNLTDLGLSYNQISDLSSLANLSELTALFLVNNQISDISALSGLTNLTDLGLVYNQISDLSSLANLTEIVNLYLDHNQIVDIQPLVDNSGMDDGDYLVLNDNPLSQHSVNDLIPILEARGVDVDYDPNNNQAPSFTSDPITTGVVGENYSYNITATDPDGDNLTITATEKPEWLTLTDNGNGNAVLSGTPDDVGEYNVSLKVDDGWAKTRASAEQSFTISVTTEAIVINFPDPNLEAAVRELINKPTGDIYNTDVNTITNCNFRDKNITNLAGMEYFISLNYGCFRDNQILDLSPLANLTELLSLDLRDNQISDLSPLANLTELLTLKLDNNQISDLSPLANLTKLGSLDLYGNQISDLSPLANLTELHSLDLRDNQILDISPLSGLTNLTFLYLWTNQISDISPLASLTELLTLELDNNQISDLSPLANLTELLTLELDNNQISDLSPLANLTKLEHLDLMINQISDLTALANLTELEILYLDQNQLSDISALTNLTNLERLSLTQNQVSDISVLANLTKLEYLYLEKNQISDLSSLSGLINLEKLWLDQNQIVDIQPLVDNSGMDDGDKLYLNDNPLSEHSINDLIPILEARGVDVDYDPSGNHAPSFTSEPVTNGIVGEEYLYNIVATDEDGDNLTITAIEKPDWLTLTETGNGAAKLAGTPVEVGSFNIKLEVSDNQAKSRSVDLQEFVLVISADEEYEEVYQEGFENGLPNDWEVSDLDGDGNNWFVADNTQVTPYEGNKAIASASGVRDTINNWLITSKDSLKLNNIFSYAVSVQGNGSASEEYQILISEAGNNPEDFTLLFEETITKSNSKREEYYERLILVPESYANKEVYFAIRHCGGSGDAFLVLDEIKLKYLAPNNPPEISAYSPEEEDIMVKPNQTIDFSVTVTDADGDELNYQWFINEEEEEGATEDSFSKSFAEEGSYKVKVAVSDGEAEISHTWSVTVTLGIAENMPKETTLYQNYPNPFNPRTKIKFYNSSLGKVKLRVYNIKGEEVATLVNGKMEQGFKTIRFNAMHLNSGVYYYRLETADKTLVKKMILIK